MIAPRRSGRIAARLLDDDHSGEVLGAVTALTTVRLSVNSSLRFSGPFIAVIGRGLGVSLSDMGLALSAGELAGVGAPAIGRAVDRRPQRSGMEFGLVLVATASALAALSPSVVVFSLAFVGIAVGKMLFDSAMGAWLADRVPYSRRAQITGFTETSWALAMLLGIPILGLVTAASNWRVAFGVCATVGAYCVVLVHRSVPLTPRVGRGEVTQPSILATYRDGWPIYVGFGALMAAANCVFVVFGAWFQDSFGMSTVQVAATAIALGVAELIASLSSMWFTDRVGKRRSVIIGATAMIPVACVFGLADSSAVAGVTLVAVYFLAFEFTIVSGMPLVGEINPSARASSIGIAVGLGTVGRGLASIVATRVYDSHGIVGPGFMAAACAAVVVVTFSTGARHLAV